MKKIPDFILFSAIICLSIPVMGSVQASGKHQIDLREPFPLQLRYPVGKILHYRLRRHSNIFHMDGTKFGEQSAVAYFTRQRIENTEDGQIQEKFT